MKQLSAADKKVIEDLFASKGKVDPNTIHPLRFKISRGMESIEVDEKNVPEAVKNCVKGEFI